METNEIVRWWLKDLVKSWIGWPPQIVIPKNSMMCMNIIHEQF